jgi:competence ComEA-like helix-hairpin-helix protein
MKPWLQNLQLSRAERNGVLVLVGGILLVLGVRLWLVFWQPVLPIADVGSFKEQIAAFEADTLLELNTATSEALQQLPGIGPSMAEKILAYREELGGYSYAEQLLDIPGIGDAKLNNLLPFISIDTALAKLPIAKPLTEPQDFAETPKRDTAVWPIKLKPHETIELNTATLWQLQQLPGIGLAFAERIEGYRQRLGGFYSLEQLREVSGIGEAKYNGIIPHLNLDSSQITRLPINSITKEELLKHPYATTQWVHWVLQNRPYRNLTDLPQEGLDKRLVPYLKTD